MSRVRAPTAGQFRLDGTVFGLEHIVAPPKVIENDGLKVVHLAVSEEDDKIKGFTQEALRQARKLAPEIRSRGKPPWLTAEWQARRRMKKAGKI